MILTLVNNTFHDHASLIAGCSEHSRWFWRRENLFLKWRFLFSIYNFLASNLSMETTGPFAQSHGNNRIFFIFWRQTSFAEETESPMWNRVGHCFLLWGEGGEVISSHLLRYYSGMYCVCIGRGRALQTYLSLRIRLVYYGILLTWQFITSSSVSFCSFLSSLKIRFFSKWSPLPLNRTLSPARKSQIDYCVSRFSFFVIYSWMHGGKNLE
jgi:hypothetical protein